MLDSSVMYDSGGYHYHMKTQVGGAVTTLLSQTTSLCFFSAFSSVILSFE